MVSKKNKVIKVLFLTRISNMSKSLFILKIKSFLLHNEKDFLKIRWEWSQFLPDFIRHTLACIPLKCKERMIEFEQDFASSMQVLEERCWFISTSNFGIFHFNISITDRFLILYNYMSYSYSKTLGYSKKQLFLSKCL